MPSLFYWVFEVDLSEQGARTQLSEILSDDDVVMPDYAGHGLFNLAVSLARVCGAEVPTQYADMQLPDGQAAAQSWRSASTVVLFLIDGLGDDFLSDNRDCAPTLWAHRVANLTSVFPSTTATAITTLMTAQPAAVHGLLGWFVRDEESDSIVAPLPMKHRAGELVTDAALIGRLLQTTPTLRSARREARFVTLPDLAAGPYSRHHAVNAHLHAYEKLEGLADSVVQAAADGEAAKFIYAYTPLLDSTAHDFGINSVESREALTQLDNAYARVRALLPDALLIVSADHGFIDSPPQCYIDFAAYPELYAMLRAPLTGERRAAYCHVRPECREIFGARVEAELGHALHAVPTALAMAAGLFGPGRSAIAEARGGDWILIARENWTLFDRLPGETPHPMIGVHGGLTHQEMRVPLIVHAPESSLN